MKLQAHMPTFSIGARDWHAAMITLASLFGAAVLLLALQSGVLLNSPLLEGGSPLPRDARNPRWVSHSIEFIVGR
jgi:hypothetical protein